MAITPAARYVNTTGAFIVGVAGGLGCSQGVKIKHYFNFDDALDAFGIHAVGGAIGGLLLGCLAKESVGGHDGMFYGNGMQLGQQLLGIVVTAVWSAIGTSLIMYTVDKTIGLRVHPKIELAGLDRSEHGTTMDAQMVNLAKRRSNEAFLLYCFCCIIGDVEGARGGPPNEMDGGSTPKKRRVATKKSLSTGSDSPSMSPRNTSPKNGNRRAAQPQEQFRESSPTPQHDSFLNN